MIAGGLDTPAHNGSMSTLDIRTIAFPDPDILAKVDGRITDHQQTGIEFVVWSAEHPTVEVNRAAIDAIILPYMDAQPTVDRLGELSNLKLVQTQTTGYDLVADLVGTDTTVATASGVHAAATAELAVGLTLASLRGIDTAVRNMAARSWNHARMRSLADRRVMILGAGGIGEAIRQRLVPFEAHVTRVAAHARTDEHGRIHGPEDLPKLLPHTEVVIAVTPLTKQTEKLIDAEFLTQLPDNALMVNVGRGKVVDTEALVAELRAGRLSAALDVVDPEPLPHEHPLWGTPNTLITPHVGGDTSAFEPRIEQMLTEQVRRIIAGEPLINVVEG